MNVGKIQIESPDQFDAAMQSIQSASMLVGSFDWDRLNDLIEFSEGPGAVLDPGLFMALQRDPQWEIKKRIFKAAATFAKELEDLREQLSDA